MRLISGLLWLLLRRLSLPAVLFLVGWYAGAKYGAPDLLIRAADGVVSRTMAVVGPLIGRGGEYAAGKAQEGGEYVVGTVEQMLRDFAEEPGDETGEEADADAPADEAEDAETAGESPVPAETSSRAQVVAGEGDIILCDMRVSNPPGASNGVTNKSGAVRIEGVELLLMPATKACLSSGYGYRNGKLHRGVDYYSDTGGDALAAGDGKIVEAVSRSDYGNMIVIDHGDGVYTRYAHLARFGSGVRKSAMVTSGQVLGPIGQTGATGIVHLHYEVLTGDIKTRAGSFGLEPVDPFSLPSAG